MKLYAVWCRWDVWLNINGNTGCYSSLEKIYEALDFFNEWEDMGYKSWKAAVKDGMVQIEEIEG